jgi:hypothetical protein
VRRLWCDVSAEGKKKKSDKEAKKKQIKDWRKKGLLCSHKRSVNV